MSKDKGNFNLSVREDDGFLDSDDYVDPVVDFVGYARTVTKEDLAVDLTSEDEDIRKRAQHYVDLQRIFKDKI